MKKFLKIIILFLVFTTIGYFIYTQYQKKAVIQGVIYTDAESVLKIGLHDIKKTLLVDALSSPTYYWRNTKLSKANKEKDSIDAIEKGIDLMPYSLVLYTAKNVKNTIFTSFKIDDATAFESYSKQYFKDKNIAIKKASYHYTIDEKAKLLFAWNTKHLVVAFNPKVSFDACKVVFDAILLHDKVITDSNHQIIAQLSATSDHITYLNGKSKISLNFQDKQALLEGLLFTNSPNTYARQISYNTIPDASLQFYFDANFSQKQNIEAVKTLFEGISFFEKNNIAIDSLLANSNGNFSLSIKGATQQVDTIITYEYDDNFEKIATKKTQEKRTPIITIDLGGKNQMNSYLKEQGAIENGVLKAIPYYTFYTTKNPSNTFFSTLKSEPLAQKNTGSYFFNLTSNFASLQQDVVIPKADKLVELLRSVQITAQQTEDNKVVLKGKLEATENDINIISQIFFGLQAQDSI